jgi:hypothetical protein
MSVSSVGVKDGANGTREMAEGLMLGVIIVGLGVLRDRVG